MSVASHYDDSKIMESHGFDPEAITFLRLAGTLLLQFRNSMSSMLTFNLLTKEPTLDQPESVRKVVGKRSAATWPTGNGPNEILLCFHDPKESRQAQMDLEGDTGWRGMSLRLADPIKATENVPW
jgi:hypothetical protein